MQLVRFDLKRFEATRRSRPLLPEIHGLVLAPDSQHLLLPEVSGLVPTPEVVASSS